MPRDDTTDFEPGFEPLPPLTLIHHIRMMTPNQPVNEDVLNTLKMGFSGYLYDGKTLDESFGVKQSRLRADYWIDERNRYLRMAAKYYIEGNTIAEKARNLTHEIKKFETLIWPRWKDLDSPKENCSLLRWHIFYAKKAWDKLPDEAQLARILKSGRVIVK